MSPPLKRDPKRSRTGTDGKDGNNPSARTCTNGKIGQSVGAVITINRWARAGEPQHHKELEICFVHSKDQVADGFTKALPTILLKNSSVVIKERC